MCLVIYPRLPFNKRCPSLRVTHPRRLASFHAHCLVSRLSLLRPELNLRSSQETRIAFPLRDLQGGSFLPLRHLLRWDTMFSPSNEFAPRWCLENAQSSSNGKRDSEGNELALALAGSSLPSDQVCFIPLISPKCFLICPLPLTCPTTSQTVPIDSLLF